MYLTTRQEVLSLIADTCMTSYVFIRTRYKELHSNAYVQYCFKLKQLYSLVSYN